jgi:hypothetical protein
MGVMAAALAGPAVPAQEPAPAPVRALRALETAANDLAKRGRVDEVRRVLDALEGAGKPAAEVDTLRQQHMAVAVKVPIPTRAKAAERAITGAVKTLSGWFDTLQGEAKRRAAAVIVELDSAHAGAQEALGRTQFDGRWVTGVRRMQLERRTLIARMLGEARQLAVPIEEDESVHEVLAAVAGAGGIAYAHEGFILHTTLPREKARRILRESLRAAAVANWIVHGELAVPEGDKVWVLLDGHAAYQRSVTVAVQKGWIPAGEEAMYRDVANWLTAQNQTVFFGPTEAFAEVSMMDDVLGVSLSEYAQPCLSSALANWTGLSYLGAPLPGFVWIEREGGEGRSPGRTTATPSAREVAERKEHQQMAKAGIAGCKEWIAYLARRREDPPWAAAFVDQRGKIQGDVRLKNTVVIEFLAERAPLQPVIEATEEAATKQARAAAFEQALGESLAEFEARWRRWILPELDDGVLQRLAPNAGGPPLSKADRATLRHLNQIRRTAFEPFHPSSTRDLQLIESLSRGCRLHGEYLHRHPAQAQAWPDAHEEYPDREGFTPEGCRAGGASVIAPGSRTPTEAIDGWMATFYHRLPLLHPGLIKIGWGRAAPLRAGDAQPSPG